MAAIAPSADMVEISLRSRSAAALELELDMIARPFPAPASTLTRNAAVSQPSGRLRSAVSMYLEFTKPAVTSPAQTARRMASRVGLGTDLACGMNCRAVAVMIGLSRRATVRFARPEGL